PCSVQDCNITTNYFHKFTPVAYEKAPKRGTYISYAYLTIGQQLCHRHYMIIVEPNYNKKSEALSEVLTEVLTLIEIDSKNKINGNTKYNFV
ncbi:1936_t:CDS:1, partial [Cetraspora pellucida]